MLTPFQQQHLITLSQIRSHRPCKDGWALLLASKPPETLSVGDVAISNGAADAMWCLRCLKDYRVMVKAILPTVERATTCTTDPRVRNCLTELQRWTDGDDTIDLIQLRNRAHAAVTADLVQLRKRAYAAHYAAAATTTVVVAHYAAITAIATVATAVATATAITIAIAATPDTVAERECQVQDLIALFGVTRGVHL